MSSEHEWDFEPDPDMIVICFLNSRVGNHMESAGLFIYFIYLFIYFFFGGIIYDPHFLNDLPFMVPMPEIRPLP